MHPLEKQNKLGPIIVRITVPEIFTGATSPIVTVTFIPMCLMQIAARAALASDASATIDGLGTLNRSLLNVVTDNIGPALSILETFLKEVRLWEFSSVFFYDGREDILRPHHIGAWCNPSQRITPADIKADLAHFAQATADSERLFAEALKKLLDQ